MIKNYIKNNKHVLILAYWPIHYAWYAILQAVTMQRNPVPISCGPDSFIPFCEWFIIPYAFWFLQITAVSLFLLIKDREGFIRLYIYMFAGMFVCMVVCTLFPMYFDRGNTLMYANDNPLTEAVKFLQGFAPPATVMPSMHVYVTVGLHIAVCRNKILGGDKRTVLASFTLCAAICLSTVFIKQHSILDAAAGLLLCVPMYFIAYKIKRR